MTVPTVDLGAVSTGNTFGEMDVTLPSHTAGDRLFIIGGWNASDLDDTDLDDWTADLNVATSNDGNQHPSLFVLSKLAASGAELPPPLLEDPDTNFALNGWLTGRVRAGTYDDDTWADEFTDHADLGIDPAAPSITPSATRDHLLVAVVTHEGDGTERTLTAPTGFTMLGSHTQDFMVLGVATRSWTTADATGTATFDLTAAAANGYRGASFLIRPATGGGGGGGSAAARVMYNRRQQGIA